MKKFLSVVDKLSILISTVGNSITYFLCYILISHSFEWTIRVDGLINEPLQENSLDWNSTGKFYNFTSICIPIIFNILIIIRFSSKFKDFFSRLLKNFCGIFISTIMCVLFYYFKQAIDKRSLLHALNLVVFIHHNTGISKILAIFLIISVIALLIIIIFNFKEKKKVKI